MVAFATGSKGDWKRATSGVRLPELVSGYLCLWCERGRKTVNKLAFSFAIELYVKFSLYVTVGRMVVIYEFVKKYDMANLREIPWKFEL